MTVYEIIDEESRESVGTLLYYEKSKAFIIELRADLNEWTAPLLFTGLVKKQIYTIPQEISMMWVRERVIPSGRQNIGSILSNAKMQEYDEMKFLEASKGKCSQDHLYIKKLENVPEYVKDRMKRNIMEVVVSGDDHVLCFFTDNTVRKINLNDLRETEGIDKILRNRQLLESAKVGIGGYSVNFGEVIDIPASVLYKAGTPIPLTVMDFQNFVRKNILDTTESCNVLECTRQNLAYLQEKQLKPVKENVKGNLFMKGDILKNRW